MNWFALEVVANGILRWQEARGVQEIDLIYSLAILIFCLIAAGSHQAPEWRTLTSVLFTSLTTFTVLMVLIRGPMESLAVFWPAVLSRLEPDRALQRGLLVIFQWLLVFLNMDQPLLLSLNGGLVVASLIQLYPSRNTRWFAWGAMGLAAGPLAIALSMSEAPIPLVKNTLLLTLPQLGLLSLSRKPAA